MKSRAHGHGAGPSLFHRFAVLVASIVNGSLWRVTHSNCVNSSGSFSLLMNQKLILMEGTKDCKYKHEKGSIRISERFLQLRTCLLYTDHCEISVKMISTEQVL